MIVKYAVVYERTPNNYCAYAPDLPGCVSTGETWDDIREMIQEAITFHLEDLMERGESALLPQMSLDEARAYHIGSIAQAGEEIPDLETTFGMVEVEVATTASSARPA